MARNLRTLDEVQNIASFAKLDASDTVGLSQCLYFSEALNPVGMKLMEVDNSLVNQLQTGQRLIIRGETTDHAVLCTKDTTYDLKLAETTNALLLVPEGITSDCFEDNKNTLAHRQVTGLIHSYFELKQTRPRLKKLLQLLEENEYEGPIAERARETTWTRYTTEDFLNSVQASEAEILNELNRIHACNIEGYWRLFSFEYMSQVLTSILNLVEENSWHLSSVPCDDVLNTLENLEPRYCIQHVLDNYGEKRDESGLIFYSMCEDRICQYYAEELLRNAGKFNLAEFLSAWQQCVPEGLKTDLQQLKGIALIDRSSFPEVIFRFHVNDLPEDDKERFNTLFKIRDKWIMEDIKPYIIDLSSETISVGAVLQKYARASTGPNGIKVFNSKRPVK